MDFQYPGVTTRFLRPDERFILSEEKHMPLMLEASESTDITFLQTLLTTHSQQLIQDIAHYGAVLLRGFDISSDEDFEKTVTSIQGFRGISEAFMSEEGRIHVGNLKYVLYTNAVYKTGGTLYLGGFHSENYYNPDVPGYICFCCLQPSEVGGETGLINMEKIYQHLSPALKEKLESKRFFVSKWLVSEVADRYQIPAEKIIAICQQFDLPLLGEDDDQFILMYKPNIFQHSITQQKSLQINLFEVEGLNSAMRKRFLADYQGKTWQWHRFVWQLPSFIFRSIKFVYIMFASFFYSPKESLKILYGKWRTRQATKKLPAFDDQRVGSCFTYQDIEDLAQLIRAYYSSCLWKKGDILLVDNQKVMHAGMPGKGPRLVRALIGNPLAMSYSAVGSGHIQCQERITETVGFYTTEARAESNFPGT